MGRVLQRTHHLGGLKSFGGRDRQGGALSLPIDPDLQEDHSQRPPSLSSIALVSVGGGIGAFLRWLLGEVPALSPLPNGAQWPLSTLIINVSGAALLALLVVKERKSWQRPLLGTGLLGGFTTFSAVTAQMHALIGDGHLISSLLYLITTVTLSLSAVALILRKS